MSDWFSNSWALWCLAALPVLCGFSFVLWLGRRRALTRLGNVLMVRGLMQVQPRARLWRGIFFLIALVFLIIGMAGPQWGRDPQPEAAAGGRDLVVVLDLSRSMLAEQPSRQERARRALKDLVDTLAQHGGHRVGLVIFAATPRLVFPLTSDYDHFRSVLNQIDADNLPIEMRPGGDSNSGTRIGAALRLAIATHDPRFKGAQDILLLSDGDDPANDDEWAQGAEEARKQKIPVHVIGLGDPDQDNTIPYNGNVLRYQDVPVMTRLREAPLQEIARKSSGTYFAARTQVFSLGRFYRDVIEPGTQRQVSEVESTADLPIPAQRYAWFLAPAVCLLLTSLLLSDRPKEGRWRVSAHWLALGIGCVAPVLIGATGQSEVERWIGRGNGAFAREEYEAALAYYEKAEESTTDPGLVAFNKAAALFRLGRYRDAELHYRRSLADQLIPALRRARAYYDLGNCLLKQAWSVDRRTIAEAIRCYRDCLTAAAGDPDLVADARHNLELARILFARAQAAAKESSDNPEPPDGPDPNAATDSQFGDGPGGRKTLAGIPDSAGTDQAGEETDDAGNQKGQPARGKLTNLPDEDKLVPLTPEETSSFLEQARQRIVRERREYHQLGNPPSDKVKDW
jgi:Ca-activated chloride channel family protein